MNANSSHKLAPLVYAFLVLLPESFLGQSGWLVEHRPLVRGAELPDKANAPSFLVYGVAELQGDP